MRKLYPFLLLVLVLGCQFNDDPKLPPVEERVSDAIEEMEDLLVAPGNGWRIDYRPNDLGGDYLILLDFDRQGNVRIQSDIGANDGEFRDHIVPYRIDVGRGVELVLETYGVFHYLFELNETSFGGEFEFIFNEEQNGDLVFDSKSDGSVIIFQRAIGNEASQISTETISLLGESFFQTPVEALVGNYVLYNMYLEDVDATVSMTIDLDLRRMKIHGIVSGQSINDILTNPTRTEIDHSTVFSISGGSIILAESRNLSFEGKSLTFSSIPIENLEKSTFSFCGDLVDSLAIFSSSNVPTLGNIELTSSLAATHTIFESGTSSSVNPASIFDADDGLSTSNQISELFPDVVAFQWYYDQPLNDGSTLNAVGWVTVDEQNNVDFILRECELIKQGNLITINWTGTYFRQESLSQEQMDGATDLLDLIFEGGQVYMLDALAQEGLSEFYNPCNRIKSFILL